MVGVGSSGISQGYQGYAGQMTQTGQSCGCQNGGAAIGSCFQNTQCPSPARCEAPSPAVQQGCQPTCCLGGYGSGSNYGGVQGTILDGYLLILKNLVTIIPHHFISKGTIVGMHVAFYPKTRLTSYIVSHFYDIRIYKFYTNCILVISVYNSRK